MRGTSRMRKSLLLVVIALMSVFILAACSDDNDNATTENDEAEVTDETEEAESTDGESYVIGATQILEHPSLDEAYNGFQAAIEDAGLNVEYDYQNAQNDQNNVKTISDNFVADRSEERRVGKGSGDEAAAAAKEKKTEESKDMRD